MTPKIVSPLEFIVLMSKIVEAVAATELERTKVSFLEEFRVTEKGRELSMRLRFVGEGLVEMITRRPPNGNHCELPAKDPNG